MAGKPRLFVIGLDAGDKDLIARWAEEGHLPNFRALLSRAARTEVRNAPSIEAGSAWPCFYFGAWPSAHGQYDGTRYFNPETYDFQLYRADEVKADPLWSVLAAAGKRCVIIDAPYTHLPTHPNCTAVFNWGAHVPLPGTNRLDVATNPPELRDEVLARFGGDPLGGKICDYHRPRSLQSLRWFRDALIERVGKRAAMTAHYLESTDWDFFLTVFSEIHCVGHHAWHIHDPSHVDFDGLIASELGDPVRDVYVATDRAIGELLQAAGDDVTTVVYMSHGMGIGYSGTRLLDRILARLEQPKARHQPDQMRQIGRHLWGTFWRVAPTSVKKALNPFRTRARKALYNEGFLPDRLRRKCFEVLLNDRTAGVRVNLAGREKHGIVQPGEEYDRLLAHITDELRKVRNLETGEPLVTEILRTDTVYSGAALASLPDLMVTWNREAPINVVHSPTIGTLRHLNKTVRTGDHKPVGLALAVGPGIRPGPRNDRVDVTDFAPTFAALFGIRHGRSDGREIPYLLARDSGGDPRTQAAAD